VSGASSEVRGPAGPRSDRARVADGHRPEQRSGYVGGTGRDRCWHRRASYRLCLVGGQIDRGDAGCLGHHALRGDRRSVGIRLAFFDRRVVPASRLGFMSAHLPAFADLQRSRSWWFLHGTPATGRNASLQSREPVSQVFLFEG